MKSYIKGEINFFDEMYCDSCDFTYMMKFMM